MKPNVLQILQLQVEVLINQIGYTKNWDLCITSLFVASLYKSHVIYKLSDEKNPVLSNVEML